MTRDLTLLEKLERFAETDRDGREAVKGGIIDEIGSFGTAPEAAAWIANRFTCAGSEQGEKGFFTALEDPDLTADLLELAHETLSATENPEPYVTPVARLLYIDKRASDKSRAEEYVQYRAAALMDHLLMSDVPLTREAAEFLLTDFYIRDPLTQELICHIWWALAERGIDISGRLNSLLTSLHNYKTPALAQNSILALWAAMRQGFFDSPIPGSDKTSRIWLWHLVTKCVAKMKKKIDEDTRLGAVGCLLDTASRYPETQSLILECMENWGIPEPKKPRSDFQKDLKELYERCKNHPGTTCLPEGHVITKKGIMTFSRRT
ncbi:hypothetical protein LBW89_20865 [Paenibacillus sp. alder61]|uniref:hypothetical protein n=1 Tax=Paenibacillus sp. alder61 TaxID=2862948 RepID=UPI001CD3EA61|nr:hypothetical protein [Paenibacillus sp. alder61]MCA1295464.1 hypothetical protein [Paenibacillus sp. alder61]